MVGGFTFLLCLVVGPTEMLFNIIYWPMRWKPMTDPELHMRGNTVHWTHGLVGSAAAASSASGSTIVSACHG